MNDKKNPAMTEEQPGMQEPGETVAAVTEEDAAPVREPEEEAFGEEELDDEYEQRHATDYDRVEFSFDTREGDVLEGVEISDKKNKVDTHRNIEVLGVFLVIWMFWGELFSNNGMQTLISWVMVLIALALLVAIFKFPASNNRKYAARLVQNSPRFEIAATRDGIDVREGGGNYYISFSGSCSVYDYKGVYAVCHDKNRVVSIPKNQLDERTEERFRGVLRQGLGDRFEKVLEDQRRPLFGKKK